MSFTLSEQMWCFLWSLLCGVALGVFYDLLRALRILVRGGKVFVFICDLLFMAVCAFASVFFSIGFSRGNTRYFVVIGEIAGFLLVRLTVGRVSVRAFEYFCKKFSKIFRKITDIIPKNAKKLLQPVQDVLYNIIRKNRPVTNGRRHTKKHKRGKRHHGVKTAE